MKTNKATFILSFLMMVLVTSAAFAQNALTWDKLGTKEVDFTIDRDVVTASSKQTYNALKIKVDNGTVNIHKVTVHFANGETQNIDLPKELTAGNDGKVIDLNGNQRVIEKITFWYDSKNSDKKKSVVEVWARK